MNNEIVSLMKRRVDELTTDEIVVVRDYCNRKIAIWQNGKDGSKVAGEMLKMMFKLHECQ